MSDLVNRLRYIGTPETIVHEVEELEAEKKELEEFFDNHYLVGSSWRGDFDLLKQAKEKADVLRMP